jgi:hypothetical protein
MKEVELKIIVKLKEDCIEAMKNFVIPKMAINVGILSEELATECKNDWDYIFKETHRIFDMDFNILEFVANEEGTIVYIQTYEDKDEEDMGFKEEKYIISTDPIAKDSMTNDQAKNIICSFLAENFDFSFEEREVE